MISLKIMHFKCIYTYEQLCGQITCVMLHQQQITVSDFRSLNMYSIQFNTANYVLYLYSSAVR